MCSVVQWLVLLVLEDSSHVNFGTSVADLVRLVLCLKDFADLQSFFSSVRMCTLASPRRSGQTGFRPH